MTDSDKQHLAQVESELHGFIDELRSYQAMFSEEKFPPLSDDEHKKYGEVIYRAAAGMGRELAEVLAACASELEDAHKGMREVALSDTRQRIEALEFTFLVVTLKKVYKLLDAGDADSLDAALGAVSVALDRNDIERQPCRLDTAVRH